MTARADAAAATGERILDAAERLFRTDPAGEPTLEEVARRAGVSVQTVIRRFEGRDGVFRAALDRAVARVEEQRATAPAGDAAEAVRVLVDHYEAHGDLAMRVLAAEARSARLGTVVARGRRLHVAWCERVFAPALAPLAGAARERRLAQLVAVCDVYTWKLLRRDRALSRHQTELALAELLAPLTAGGA